jgi:hypothetical protein
LLFRTGRISKRINCDNLDLVTGDQKPQLEKDLEEGFRIKEIKRIETEDIDTVNNRVKLKVAFMDRKERTSKINPFFRRTEK